MNDLFKVFTVTELTRVIKDHLESRFTALEVEGEISNFRPSSTGHYYFTLKDQGAMLSAVMFNMADIRIISQMCLYLTAYTGTRKII